MGREFALLLLRLFGWKTVGGRPKADKFVMICAPHTTNWDLLILLAFCFVFELRIGWIGKHTLFRGPLGWLMRLCGGLPLDRSRPKDAVATIAAALRASDRHAIAICPEGTRGRTEYWKSGFYRIAMAADVPVVCAVVDYERRQAGFAGTFRLTGRVAEDMDHIRSLYRGLQGRFPERFGPVRLRDESNAEEPAA